jgi:ribosomal protein S18 acetylase RimI-like enzyme
LKIVKARWEEHAAVTALAKLSKFTKGFASGGLRYVDTYYQKGWVYLAKERGRLLGFCCVRHCVNKPHTSIYYIGVKPELRGKGIGRALLQAVRKDSRWPTLELISEKENEQGFAAYKALGFNVVGEGANAAGVPYWRLHQNAS